MELPTDSVFSVGLSRKQEELLTAFRGLIQQHGINLEINPESYSLDSVVAIDVEHDETGGLVGIGAYNGKVSYYWTTSLIGGWIQTAQLIAHNGVSDLDALRAWGINVREEQLVWDTMFMGHILDSSLKTYGLKDMAKRELGISYPSYDDIVGKRGLKAERILLDKQPLELVSMYNALDCFATYKLYEKQVSLLRSGRETSVSHYFKQLEKPVSCIFDQMSTLGVRVDLDYLKGLKEILESQQRPIKEAILNELGPINLNSPKQLLEALHGKRIFPQFKGKPSTDKRALQALQGTPLVAQLLGFSELETLLSSFVYPYLERGQEYVHPFFNQVGTRTGRPSCSNPNLLQIPRKTENGKLVRRMFIPRDGMVMGDCDFGQIEPRVLAHLSKDPALCSLFTEGIDFHEYTAERLGIDRERAKVLNLSVGYRATFKSVSAQLRCANEEAQQQIDAWWGLFPALRRWQDKLIFDSTRSGYCTTLFGRRIKIEGLQERFQWKKEAAERQLINNITQGSAAEIMKKAMINIHETAPTIGLLVQVYDELLWESANPDQDAAIIVNCMENAVKLDVPLTVDCKIGKNWAECH